MSSDARWNPRANAAPPFGARRLLLLVTGSSAAVFLPPWLSWLCFGYPDLECKVVLTRSAQHFVTAEGLRPLGPSEVLSDDWSPAARERSLHVELAQWPDAVAVYPGSMNFLARFALGAVDTPALLALQCTTAPIAIAAALPPGGWDCAAMLRHRRELADRPNVAVLPPVPGRSMTTGQQNGNQPGSLPELITLLERTRTALAD
jgi:phosphopantothenoylcysteine decarboxylase/phosphopantothenate--cysteine ligase